MALEIVDNRGAKKEQKLIRNNLTQGDIFEFTDGARSIALQLSDGGFVILCGSHSVGERFFIEDGVMATVKKLKAKLIIEGEE